MCLAKGNTMSKTVLELQAELSQKQREANEQRRLEDQKRRKKRREAAALKRDETKKLLARIKELEASLSEANEKIDELSSALYSVDY